MSDFEILPGGENSLCLSFPTDSDWCLQTLAENLRQAVPELSDVVPAYDSITLVFDSSQNSIEVITDLVVPLLIPEHAKLTADSRTEHLIPVCYDPAVAKDIMTVCEKLNISLDDLIAQHTKTAYSVAMLGFQPGFIYLDGLSETLAVARKETPEISLPSGSVAIGGNQTGIYSLASPGGWWVIGRTPQKLFFADLTPPLKITHGDSIRFQPVSLSEYREISDAD